MTREGRTCLRVLVAAVFVLPLWSAKLHAGIFRQAKSFSTGGIYNTALVAGDVNGDGKLDVVVASSGLSDPGTVSILLGDGAGNFTMANTYEVDEATSLAISDLNGDGRLDIIAGRFSVGAALVLLGNGDGSFQTPVVYETGASYTVGVALADLNHDGKLVLVTTNLC